MRHDPGKAKSTKPEGMQQVAQRTMTMSRQVDGSPDQPPHRDSHPSERLLPLQQRTLHRPCPAELKYSPGAQPNKPQLTQRRYTPEGTDTGAVSISTREDGRDRRPSANPALHMHTLQE